MRFPHTQTVGVPVISQSYLRWIASLNSLLFRSKSKSLLGITVNQFDAPFSLAKLTALFVLSGRELLHSSDRLSNLSSFSFFSNNNNNNNNDDDDDDDDDDDTNNNDRSRVESELHKSKFSTRIRSRLTKLQAPVQFHKDPRFRRACFFSQGGDF